MRKMTWRARRLVVPWHTEPLSLGVAGAPRGIGICVGFGEAGGVAVEDVGAGALWAGGAGSLNATSGSAGVLLDVSQDNAMDHSDILDGVAWCAGSRCGWWPMSVLRA